MRTSLTYSNRSSICLNQLAAGFQETIIERAKRILWTRFAAEMETEALLDYAAQQSRIEEQAALYEGNGQTHIAEMLRAKAADISPENPMAAAERTAKLLGDGQTQTPRLPAPTKEKSELKKLRNKPITGAKGRGRPKKVVAQSPSVPEVLGPKPDEVGEA